MAEEWDGDFDPIRDDPEERRVLFAALDSFRYALQERASHLIPVFLCAKTVHDLESMCSIYCTVNLLFQSSFL